MNWRQGLVLGGLATLLFLGTATLALSAQGRLQSTVDAWFGIGEGEGGEDFGFDSDARPPQTARSSRTASGDSDFLRSEDTDSRPFDPVSSMPSPAGDLAETMSDEQMSRAELDRIARSLRDRELEIEARAAAVADRENDVRLMMAEIDDRLRSVQRERVEVAQSRQELLALRAQFESEVQLVTPDARDDALREHFRTVLAYYDRFRGSNVESHVREQWFGEPEDKARIVRLGVILSGSDRQRLLGAISDGDLKDDILDSWLHVLNPNTGSKQNPR